MLYSCADRFLLLSIFLFPVSGVLLSLLWKKQGWVGFSLFVVNFLQLVLLAGFYLFLFRADRSVVLFHSFRWFQLAHGLVFGVNFYMDFLSWLMLVVATVVSLLTSLYALGYLELLADRKRYFLQVGLFLCSTYWVILSGSLFSLYIGWECMGFLSALLTAFWYMDKRVLLASRYVFLVNKLGSICFLLGLLIMLHYLGDPGWIALRGYYLTYPGAIPCWFSTMQFLFLVAIVAKLAQFPFFIWLPKAMVAPIPISVLLHTATVLGAGIYFLFRLQPTCPPQLLSCLVVVGYLTVFLASTAAWAQNRVKSILAYSTIIHLGYIIIAIGLGDLAEALLHFVIHTFAKVCLFFCLGVVEKPVGEPFDVSSSAEKFTLRRLYMAFPLVSTVYLAAIGGLYLVPISKAFSIESSLLSSTYVWLIHWLGLVERTYWAYGWFVPYTLLHLLGLASLIKSFFLLFESFLARGSKPLAIRTFLSKEYNYKGSKYMRLALLFSILPLLAVYLPFIQRYISYSLCNISNKSVKINTYPFIFSLSAVGSYVGTVFIVFFIYRKFKADTYKENQLLLLKSGWYVANGAGWLANQYLFCVAGIGKLEARLIAFIQRCGKNLFLLGHRLMWLEYHLWPVIIYRAVHVFDWLSRQYRRLQSHSIQHHLSWIIWMVATLVVSVIVVCLQKQL
jgi:NADH:ubiquinone oxidoreductase subunit 5 (subunit L)/multisubunit Na+/H+ antiporter MnhA subunit